MHPYARRDYERLIIYSKSDQLKKHCISNDPSQADLILFVGSSDPNFSDVRSSALYRMHKNKSFIFYSGDKSIPIIPGVYTCLAGVFANRRRTSALSGYYLRVTDNKSLDMDEQPLPSKFLYSFIGNANNHSSRKKICGLPTDRAYIRDSANDAVQQSDGVGENNKDRGNLYRSVLIESKFVLCPRGIGVSTWRLFETMRAGRVPVIISDQWILPDGPDWTAFAIFVNENEIDSIPELLRQHEHLSIELGRKARSEWEKYYSQERVFSTLIDQVVQAQEGYRKEHPILRFAAFISYLDPYFFQHWVLSPIKTRLKALLARR